MTARKILGFAFAIGLAACGGSSTPNATVTVTLNAQGSSGQMGTAVLADNGDNTTTVTITTNVSSDTGTQPAHIHVGTCGSNGNIFTPLASVQNGTSSMKVPYALSSLTGGKYYINVHNSANIGTIQACGNIP
jgi:hypothetical protein